ncbi:MAG: S8 family peptidase [bacterium]|nr:S8 family peptidase [bacterium]
MPSLCSESILSEDYADFILPYGGIRQPILEQYPQNCVLFPSPEFFLLYEPIEERRLSPKQAYSYFSIPKLYAPIDSTSMERSGIPAVQSNPLLNLDGRGVLIGFMDSGIDWQSPAFLGEDGQTRILRIWDQSLTAKEGDDFSSPASYPYGLEFTKEQIDAALDGSLPPLPTTDESGHGSFAAGIAAGGRFPNSSFTGAAPNAFLAMVKLKPAKSYLRTFFGVPESAIAYQENDLLTAAIYLTELARRENLPLILCVTTGTTSGSHDGTSPLGHILSQIAVQIGCAVVIAAGNEGGEEHHYFGQLDQANPEESVSLRVGEGENGFTLELWANLPERYSIRFTSPSGEVLPEISVSYGEEERLGFRLDPTLIYVSYHEAEVGSGDQLILMRFLNPTPGIWRIQVRNTFFLGGNYHIWLPIKGFVKEDTVFLRPNPDVTLTEPANASSPITVSTYNHYNNSIYIHSGRGYTRDGRIKPDLSAPGVDVFGPNTGQTLRFTRKTGSCIAAAHTAGAAACLMQWGLYHRNSPSMNSTIIKSMLIRGAERSPAYSYPNREFGYGTLNLYQSLTL